MTTSPAVCDDCGQRIVPVTIVATGNRLPVDPIPTTTGDVAARPAGTTLHGYVIGAGRGPSAAFTRYAAHAATCPNRPRPEPAPAPVPEPTLFDA